MNLKELEDAIKLTLTQVGTLANEATQLTQRLTELEDREAKRVAHARANLESVETLKKLIPNKGDTPRAGVHSFMMEAGLIHVEVLASYVTGWKYFAERVGDIWYTAWDGSPRRRAGLSEMFEDGVERSWLWMCGKVDEGSQGERPEKWGLFDGPYGGDGPNDSYQDKGRKARRVYFVRRCGGYGDKYQLAHCSAAAFAEVTLGAWADDKDRAAYDSFPCDLLDHGYYLESERGRDEWASKNVTGLKFWSDTSVELLGGFKESVRRWSADELEEAAADGELYKLM